MLALRTPSRLLLDCPLNLSIRIEHNGEQDKTNRLTQTHHHHQLPESLHESINQMTTICCSQVVVADCACPLSTVFILDVKK
jgi:hypothetical protein